MSDPVAHGPADRRDPAEVALVARLRVDLRPRTLAHSLAVRDQAMAQAAAFGAAPGAVALAGLLHDCAKGLAPRQYLLLAAQADLELFAAERASPELLHQRVGAYLAATRYEVRDPVVTAAIACHTTGRADMDAVARCLFVADYVSPDRDYAGVDRLRAALSAGPDQAFRAVLSLKRRIVAQRGLPEHPWAEAAYARWLPAETSSAG